jgi:hypothetical protein
VLIGGPAGRIFIGTNLLMLLASVIGLAIVLYHRRRNPSE